MDNANKENLDYQDNTDKSLLRFEEYVRYSEELEKGGIKSEDKD